MRLNEQQCYYLVDNSPNMVKAWEIAFQEEFQQVKILKENIKNMILKEECDCFVTCGNSFGIMSSGTDLIYKNIFPEILLETIIREKIENEYAGEQPIGTSISVDIPGLKKKKLIYTPIIRSTESPLIDPRQIYTATRSSIIEAVKTKRKHIVLPAFGRVPRGRMKSETVAQMMERAIFDISKHSMPQSFDEITQIDFILKDHFIF